jgi:tetratricopeptide (TPR) repeat protein
LTNLEIDDSTINKLNLLDVPQLMDALGTCKDSHPELAVTIHIVIINKLIISELDESSTNIGNQQDFVLWYCEMLKYGLANEVLDFDDRDAMRDSAMQWCSLSQKLRKPFPIIRLLDSFAEIFATQNLEIDLIESLLLKCEVLARNDQYEEVIPIAETTLGISRIVEDYTLAGRSALAIAESYFVKTDAELVDLSNFDLEKAKEYSALALEYFENSGDTVLTEKAKSTISKIYDYLKKYEIALDYVEQCIELHKKLSETDDFSLKVLLSYYQRKGKLLRKRARSQESKECLTAAILEADKFFPSVPSKDDDGEMVFDPEQLSIVYPSLRLELAWTLADLKEYEKAWEEFVQASRFTYGFHSPKMVQANYGLAFLLWKHKRFEASLRICEETLDNRLNIFPWTGEKIFSLEGDARIFDLIDKNSRPTEERDGAANHLDNLRIAELEIHWIFIIQTALNLQSLKRWDESIIALDRVSELRNYIPSTEQASEVDYLRANAMMHLNQVEFAKNKLDEIIDFALIEEKSSGLANALWLRAEKFGSSDPKSDQRRAIEMWNDFDDTGFATEWQDIPDQLIRKNSGFSRKN